MENAECKEFWFAQDDLTITLNAEVIGDITQDYSYGWKTYNIPVKIDSVCYRLGLREILEKEGTLEQTTNDIVKADRVSMCCVNNIDMPKGSKIHAEIFCSAKDTEGGFPANEIYLLNKEGLRIKSFLKTFSDD